jgi:hypothetical protein
VHVLDWPDPALTIPWAGNRVVRAAMLQNGAAVEFTQTAADLTLRLPRAPGETPDRAVILVLQHR